MAYTVALIPGDGIGTEVVTAARPLLDDVVVASYLFGDRDAPSMFKLVHGNTPDIQGQGIANPLATILSRAMLFDGLGEDTAGDRLCEVVDEQVADDSAPRTPDLRGDAGIADVAMDLRARL